MAFREDAIILHLQRKVKNFQCPCKKNEKCFVDSILGIFYFFSIFFHINCFSVALNFFNQLILLKLLSHITVISI